jgi:O-antigen/teichoic acid export membrane protein
MFCVVAYTPLLLNADFLQIGRGRERDLAVPRMVNATVYLCVALVCMALDASLFFLPAAIAVGNLVGTRVQYWYVQRAFHFDLGTTVARLWRSHVRAFDYRASLLMVFVPFGYPLLHSLDVFWLGRIAPTEVLGEYAAAYRLTFVLADIYALIGMTALSHFSAVGPSGRSKLGRPIGFALLAASGLAILVALFAAPIVGVTFGSDYRDSAVLLRVFSVVSVIYLAAVLFSNKAVADHRQGDVFVAYTVAIGLSLLLKLMFKPTDALTALTTTVIAETVLVCLLLLGSARASYRDKHLPAIKE